MTTHPIDVITTLVLQKRDENTLEAAARAVDLRDMRILAGGLAIEGRSDLSDAHAGAAILNAAGIKADIALTPVAGRRKTLLICDMDSTLIGQECIDELADFAGVKSRVSAITERAMRGEIGFDGALRERVGLLTDLPLTNLQRCFDERITVNPGAKTLVATMKAHGAKTVIVSGGFTFFSERVAHTCGFHIHQANILLDDGKALTGKVADPILGREAKLDAMLQHSDNGGRRCRQLFLCSYR